MLGIEHRPDIALEARKKDATEKAAKKVVPPESRPLSYDQSRKIQKKIFDGGLRNL
jgi:hypothetical protein